MLMYGPLTSLQYIDRGEICNIWNLDSGIENIPNINLMPPNELGKLETREFDYNYMKWILDIDTNFIELMKIMLALYQNQDVYLVINDRDIWSLQIVDSLMKLIQQRYGINGILIESSEDVSCARDEGFDPYFGIQNMDQDSERYQYLYYLYHKGKAEYE